MEEQWFVTRKGADFEAISKRFHISPIIARLIRNREIIGNEAIDEYLGGNLEHLHDGILLKDMKKAVDILMEKIQAKKSIRIIGDYDIDGVNATYILLEGLRYLGARVDSDIPDRMKDGYGLNVELINRAIEAGVDTIVTCDNGIAAQSEIAYARDQGLSVIITDHHEVPYEDIVGEDGIERHYLLPDADAIIDPKQEGCNYPFKGLCGAAVAYKLVEVLFQFMGEDPEDVDYLMENVAIATIGDVMDLVDENRIFVKQGLEMLKQTKNLGLRALMEKTMDDIERLEAYHIGFVIGPCLNAGGRLDTAKRALELMLSKSKSEAEHLAEELKNLNEQRKEMTLQGVEEAKIIVEKDMMADKILVVYLPDCHESLAGIIAGRLRETYHKPVFVLTKGEESVKGSGRSIEAYHMYEEMSKCKDLLLKYGGHKLAAGLSMKEKNVNKFRRILNQATALSAEDLIPKVSIDMQLPITYVDENLIQQLHMLEPFGKGNVKPSFVEKDLEITRLQIIGKNQNVAKMILQDSSGCEMTGIHFMDVERLMDYISEKYSFESLQKIKRGHKAGVKLSFIYYPSINVFNGYSNIQLILNNYK